MKPKNKRNGVVKKHQPPAAAIKSPLELARLVYRTAQDSLEKYSSPFSRHDYTQAQLFTVLVLKVFYRLDYRGIAALVADFSDLRQVLELDDDKSPDHSTLAYAEGRLLKKSPSKLSSSPYFSWLGRSGRLAAVEDLNRPLAPQEEGRSFKRVS